MESIDEVKAELYELFGEYLGVYTETKNNFKKIIEEMDKYDVLPLDQVSKLNYESQDLVNFCNIKLNSNKD